EPVTGVGVAVASLPPQLLGVGLRRGHGWPSITPPAPARKRLQPRTTFPNKIFMIRKAPRDNAEKPGSSTPWQPRVGHFLAAPAACRRGPCPSQRNRARWRGMARVGWLPPHSRFPFEMEKTRKLVLRVGGRAGGGHYTLV